MQVIMSFTPAHVSFELCSRSPRNVSELRTRAVCASFLTTCCLCSLAGSSLTPTSSKETLSKKRQLQREARMYTCALTHVKGEKDTWQHKGVLKGLGAALQLSSHFSTRLFCPKAAGEQAIAENFSSAGGRQGLRHHLSSEQISICTARQRATSPTSQTPMRQASTETINTQHMLFPSPTCF